MIHSMTGFGKVTVEFPTKKLTVELRALNSKQQLDIYTRLPHNLREREMELRALLLQRLGRGKVEFTILIDYIAAAAPAGLNPDAMIQYYHQLQQIAHTLGIAPPVDWLTILLRLPDVVKTDLASPDDEEWTLITDAVQEAIQRLCDFRRQEGLMIEDILTQKIHNISALLKEIDLYEGDRIQRIKSRISDTLEKNPISADYDKNRFEQELIFYIEKLDINEEKSRLNNHLDYFLNTMKQESAQGRKLGFIAQEIGREINTIGSKANHAQMQKIVVRMKDELEQIKEQVLNIL
ncbi:MAG: YicC family protein [Tannerellaceae bacterium]|jgi:uncharacterized protein (TIGR00255 family)|nr:YicC family protein [Tannerellaceae bacterium]